MQYIREMIKAGFDVVGYGKEFFKNRYVDPARYEATWYDPQLAKSVICESSSLFVTKFLSTVGKDLWMFERKVVISCTPEEVKGYFAKTLEDSSEVDAMALAQIYSGRDFFGALKKAAVTLNIDVGFEKVSVKNSLPITETLIELIREKDQAFLSFRLANSYGWEYEGRVYSTLYAPAMEAIREFVGKKI